MAFRVTGSIRNRFKQTYDTYRSKINEIKSRIENFETPERIKGTIIERWGKYWKNLYIDYKDVAVDAVQGCKDRPIRASIYFSIIGGGYYLFKHNPDEQSYREQLLLDSIRVMQVGEGIRNPIAVQHLKWIEQCYNEGIVHRLSLGVLSFIWLDNYERACAHYKATCTYLKPQYLGFHHRIVDIGLLDKWWLLEDKMKDFDVNESEFQHNKVVPSLNNTLPT